MRLNQSVTNRECDLVDDEIIVSRTDLQGNITYVNDVFIRVSGFSEVELLGAPQNIVRHPDMPAEAFADFWKTIKSGKVWTGLVKNRCKNGDHYWVEASVAPLIQGNQVIGYTSVRIKAKRDSVNAAEAVYRAIKTGNASIRVHEGAFVSAAASRNLNPLARMRVATKITFFSSMLTFLMLFFAMIFLTGLSRNYGDILAVIGLAGAILSCFFGVTLHQTIIVPIRELTSSLATMSSSDLSATIRAVGDNELTHAAQGLRILQTNLKCFVGQIKESTSQVNSGVLDIADRNADLSARTASQSSSLEETAFSMEELTATVKQNADHSREASQVVASAAQVAERGGVAVSNVVSTMGAIKVSSRKISDIIGVIDSIAFQTNILALNAAVEAVHAGELGQGFALVANEVRNLAQRSANAAKEIKVLINDSVTQVDVGAKLVEDARGTMGEIVSCVKRAAEIMHDITADRLEQSADIDQVNQGLLNMDEMTRQNASLVEEAAASAESLKNHADKLTNLVNSFHLVRLGNASGSMAKQAKTLVRQPTRTQTQRVAISASNKY